MQYWKLLGVGGGGQIGRLGLFQTNWEVGGCCVTSTDCLLSSPAIDPSIDTDTNRNPNEYKYKVQYVKLHQFTQIWIEIRQTTFHTTASEFVFAHQPCICIMLANRSDLKLI